MAENRVKYDPAFYEWMEEVNRKLATSPNLVYRGEWVPVLSNSEDEQEELEEQNPEEEEEEENDGIVEEYRTRYSGHGTWNL